MKNGQALDAEMAQTLSILSARWERDETVGQDVCGVD